MYVGVFGLSFKNVLSPLLMILATVYAHGITPYREAASEGRFAFSVLFYLIVFSAVMLAGWLASLRHREKQFNRRFPRTPNGRLTFPFAWSILKAEEEKEGESHGNRKEYRSAS